MTPNLESIKRDDHPLLDIIASEYLKNEGRITVKDLAKKYSCEYKQVQYRMKKRKLPYRYYKYQYDEAFFEKIDTEEKAYVLGWWYSDGSVYAGNGKKKDNAASLSITEKDEYILKKIRDLIAKDAPIRWKDRRNVKWQNVVTLSITNKKIVNDLIKLRCTPNKTATLELPTPDIVPKHLMPHFLRGHFDGDGCMYFHIRKDTKRPHPRCLAQFTSSIAFCSALSSYLLSLGIKNCLKKPDKHHPRNTNVVVGGRRQLIKLVDYLYGDMRTDLFLARKRNVYTKYLEAQKEYDALTHQRQQLSLPVSVSLQSG